MGTSSEQAPDGTTHHLAHQWDDEIAIGDRIVDAIAEQERTKPGTLPPIEESINPGALDELFDTTSDGGPKPGCVTFSYFGYTVVVQSTGRILLKRT